MGSQRRRIIVGLAACLGLGVTLLPRPGWCAGDGDDAATSLGQTQARITATTARSSADKVLTLQAEPAFIGCNNYSYSTTSVPIAVSVTNRGAARDATIEIEAAPPYAGMRTYRRLVHLEGNAVTHVTLNDNFRSYVETVVVRLETGNSVRAEVTTPLSIYGNSNYSSGNEGRMALLSDRLGALRPVMTGQPSADSSSNNNYETCYLKPESAPDHADGYRSLKVLVAGVGAERLTSAQWQAVREWVVGGGSLIILGQKEWSKAAPEFAELSPERVSDPSQTRVMENVPVVAVVNTSEGYTTTAIAGTLQPNAVPLNLQKDVPEPYSAAFARKQVGAGIVLYSGIDYTDHNLRTNDVTRMWAKLGHLASSSGHWRYNYDTKPDWTGEIAGMKADAAHNPFNLALPPLNEIVYVFTAYFLLAVPITFVVLKRTRRMNLAWATGPVLAVVFAGVFYLFSFRLYRAPLSRRTAGQIYAAAGDKQARFTGYTEMFFPHAGSYDVTVPHSDRMEYFGEEGFYDGDNGYGLKTIDDGATLQTPEFGVSNLAFRRLHHAETVDWGTGITAKMHVVTGNPTVPKLAGTITNGTGLTLHHVHVTWKDRYGAVHQYDSDTDCPPGETTLPLAIAGVANYSSDDVNLASPVLSAQVDGASFGPRLGNDVSGSGTVNVIVSLPLATDAKGGSR